MVEINADILRKNVIAFKKFLKEDPRGNEWQTDRENKERFFKENFSEDTIDKLDVGILRDLIYALWSYAIWNKKDYILEQMQISGLPNIKTAFKILLYSRKPLSERFDEMRKIRMMGAASISEILACHDPTKYPIYNRRSKRALTNLGVKKELLPKHSQITGIQYEEFCKTTQDVLQKTIELDPSINDMFKLDLLLYYIDIQGEAQIVEKEEDFDHDQIIEDLLQLGDGLGFDVNKNFPVTKGCIIDAIWKVRVANLGSIACAFEVHRRGSRDSAILNLQRCLIDPSVQQVVIVSNEKELQSFRDEIISLPENFREAVCYLDLKTLKEAVIHQESLKEILANVGLLKTSRIRV